ncbi:arginine--tRNA ligase [Salirhabdus salicampi]|uniref:arginine--tRNA ligase n=1 Tax=Salirhabdus salicampi TaxID=476102 RepID=UPI0020C54839|nr:arginine--tRNA ligase [Salirhabdus salicampi]MCP8617399.1 arginine--tRNA ligase [Salirhabdus salicampi]
MNIVEQVEQKLKEEIVQSVIKAQLATEEQIPTVILETPKEKAHGDYATNMAMQLARVARKAPRQIAEEIVKHFDQTKASIESIDIAGPGFINFHLDNSFLTDLVTTVLDQGDNYGKTNVGNGEKVQIEFVSANPTGTLHLGHARGAAFGDALANIMDTAGYHVEREYYINDAGNQMNNLAKSVEARYMQALEKDWDMPEDGYFGQDIVQLGKKLAEEEGEKWVDTTEEERLAYCKQYGLSFLLNRIKEDLESYRVTFDNWFSETSLYEDGKVEESLNMLQEKGYLYEAEGALWFRSTDFGDDKDRVLVKKDGSYTYLTPDISYHNDKFRRGFKTLINVWGADHHGYIPRMKAAITALGYNPEDLEVPIIQMVNLIQDGEIVKMSKRTGKAVTMLELIEEVGLDAVRYFFVMRSNDSHLDFDMDLATSQSNENPVYYVQYAHARICSVLRQAEEKGFKVEQNFDKTLLSSEKEVDVLKRIGEFPQVVGDAAEKRAPHRITQYVFDLAADFHSFYNAEKVVDIEHAERTKARLALIEAVRITIANSLQLIGVQAPERM